MQILLSICFEYDVNIIENFIIDQDPHEILFQPFDLQIHVE